MKGKTARATEAQTEKRIEELLAIRLDGAELWDVREYVREKVAAHDPVWGKNPLSDSQLYRYLQRVDSHISESCKEARSKLLRRHLAQRRRLYARAVNVGDVRAALAALRDEAELLDLYPKPEDELRKEVESLKRELAELTKNHDGDSITPDGTRPTSAVDTEAERLRRGA